MSTQSIPRTLNSPGHSEDLRRRTSAAGLWRLASMLLQAVLHLAVGIVLARMLPPADFGLAALAWIIVGFAKMFSGAGIAPAVIQHRELTEAHLRVALTLSMIASAAVACLLLVTAPLIGSLARSAQLPALIRAESLLFPTFGLGAVARALLQRWLNFRRLLIIDIASFVFGYALVGIGGALAGWGVWSLVIGSLAQSLLSTILSLTAVGAPLRPLLMASEIRDLLGYSVRVSTNSTVSYLARNGDSILVGRLLGAHALGLYSRAYNLMMLPLNYICSALPEVLIPALAEIQDDRKRMGRGYLLGVQLAALASAPIMAGVVVSAPHLIPALYGERWVGAIVPLQILGAVGMVRAIEPLPHAVTRACDRIGTELWLQLGFAAAVLAGTTFGSRYGLPVVAVFVSIAILLMYLATAKLALSLTGLRWSDFFAAHIPGTLLGCFSAALMILVRVSLEHLGLSHLPIFLVLVLTGILSIPVGIFLLPRSLRSQVPFHHVDSLIAVLPPVLGQWVLRLKNSLVGGSPCSENWQ